MNCTVGSCLDNEWLATVCKFSPTSEAFSAAMLPSKWVRKDFSNPQLTIDEAFRVPCDLRPALFPSPDASITTVLRELPKFSSATIRSPSLFFSKCEPSVLTPELTKSIAIDFAPDLQLLDAILHVKTQMWNDGFRSIVLPHHPDVACQLPLWAVTYWRELADLSESDDAVAWRSALSFLMRFQDTCGQNSAVLGAEVRNLLDVVAFSTSGSQILGFSVKDKLTKLASFLSSEWLSDLHEGLMLDGLSMELARMGIDEGVRFVSPDWMSSFFTRYKRRAHPGFLLRGGYRKARNAEFLRRVGREIESGAVKTLAGVIHRPGHWVCWVMDCEKQRFLYGDSMGDSIPMDVVNAFDWFGKQHGLQLRFTHLPITDQNGLNTFSCGDLTLNALRHYFMPSVSLCKSTREEVLSERVRSFVRVMSHHLATVRLSVLAQNIVSNSDCSLPTRKRTAH